MEISILERRKIIKTFIDNIINYFKKYQEKDNRLLNEYTSSGKEKEDNDNTKIPEDENVSLKSFWMFEIYTPNEIDSLLDNIKQSKLAKYMEKFDPDLINKVNSLRYSSKSGWIKLGTLEPYGKSTLSNSVEANIPNDFQSVDVKLYQELSSITIVAYKIVLRNSELIENILNNYYKGYIKNGHLLRVHEQKKIELEKELTAIHNKGYNWIKMNFSGYFITNNVEIPTIDLITFDKLKISNVEENWRYPRLIGLDNKYDFWRWEDVEGVFWKGLLSSSNKSNLILTGNVNKIITSKKNKEINLIGKNKISFYIDKKIKDPAVIWINSYIYNTLHNDLLELRDELAQINISNSDKTASKITRLRNKMNNLENILPYFIKDLSIIKSRYYDKFNEYENLIFESINDDYEINPIEYYFNRSIDEKNILKDLYNTTRENYYSLSNLYSLLINKDISKNNLSVQKQVLFITFLMLIINFIMLFNN